MVANPIWSGMEFESPAALTPPRMKIWNNISVNPATKVAPNRVSMILAGALNTSFRFCHIESLLGGQRPDPRKRANTIGQRNLHTIKFKWNTPGGEWVHKTALFKVAHPNVATRHIESAIPEFVGSNIRKIQYVISQLTWVYPSCFFS